MEQPFLDRPADAAVRLSQVPSRGSALRRPREAAEDNREFLLILLAMRVSKRDNSGMKSLRLLALGLLLAGPAWSPLRAFDKQPASTYRARRVALAGKLHGGVAILFAAEESQLDFTPYRQDSNFYYLTGWTEPGAALLIAADAPNATTPRTYREVLFLPARNVREEGVLVS